MKSKECMKQFFAGAVFPAVAYAALIGLSNLYGPLYSVVNFWWVPLFAGLWNVIYFFRVENGFYLVNDWNYRMLVNGAIVGAVVAIIAIWTNTLSGIDLIVRLIAFPLVGSVLWMYVTSYFNYIFDLEK